MMEYRVEGNKLLPTIRIEQAVYPFLGENKTIADVERARGALEKAYQDAGYLTVLVDIPEQTVAGGIVRLRVTEGKVERIRVVGSRYYDLGRILAEVPELAQGNVPYFPGLQQEMAVANSAVGVGITPVLRPGKTPGTVEAELKVEDKLPLHASVELSNYASPNTDPLRLTGMVRYDNLWQKQHSASLQYQTSPQDTNQVKVFSGTYLIPLAGGNQLALYAVASHSNVASVGDLTLLGKGHIAGARWVVPMTMRQGLFHSFTFGVDYKDFTNDSMLAGSDTGHTPISYIPFSVGYSASMQDGKGVVDNANATLNFNLRGIGDRMTSCDGQTVSQFACMRYGAQADYFYLRGAIDHTQPLSLGLSMFVKLDGQITSGPLISNEQMVAGGADSVRGYYEAEQAGDDGVHGTLEMRGPQWAKGNVNDLRVLAFVDGAHLRVREPLPSQVPTIDLTSAGVGLRSQAWGYFNVRMDIAWPFKDTLYTGAGKHRIGVKASMVF